MQRKQIKIGEAYAVVASRSTGRRQGTPVKGVVLGFDGEYQSWTSSTWHSREITKRDGVRVRFEEPMMRSHDSFHPLSQIEARADQVADSYLEEARKKASTEAVLQSVQMVKEPWAEYAEREARFDEARLRWARENDAKGDVAEPVIAAIRETLEERGIAYGIKKDQRDGTSGKRTLSATYTLGVEEMAKLLGVGVTA